MSTLYDDLDAFNLDEYLEKHGIMNEVTILDYQTDKEWRQDLQVCESPIEQVLYVFLIIEKPSDMGIYAQKELHSKQTGSIRRVDFLIALEPPLEGYLQRPLFVIETDGKHHNDEAAVILDKVRDRDLFSEGYSVIRFSGKEIMSDPDAQQAYVYGVFRQQKQNLLDGVFPAKHAKDKNPFSLEYERFIESMKKKGHES